MVKVCLSVLSLCCWLFCSCDQCGKVVTQNCFKNTPLLDPSHSDIPNRQNFWGFTSPFPSLNQVPILSKIVQILVHRVGVDGSGARQAYLVHIPHLTDSPPVIWEINPVNTRISPGTAFKQFFGHPDYCAWTLPGQVLVIFILFIIFSKEYCNKVTVTVTVESESLTLRKISLKLNWPQPRVNSNLSVVKRFI